MAIIGMLLGVGAGVAGAASGSGNAAGAGAGIAMGSGEMAMRSVLNYQRTEEMTADRLAVNYLNATGQSTKGMLDTFERFASALSLTGTQIDQYRISHPLPRERIANLEELARKSPYFNKADSPALQLRHDMARAKIAAYSGNMGALQRMFRNNPGGPCPLWQCHHDIPERLGPRRTAQVRRLGQGAAEEPIFPGNARRSPAESKRCFGSGKGFPEGRFARSA